MNRQHFIRLGALALLGSSAWLNQLVAAPARARTLLVLGDSLSAEYGLARGSGWVALLTEKLKRENAAVQVVNASVSGDTTSGGRSRLPDLLTRHQPSHVVLELGGNDALRGLPLDMTRANLAAIVQAAQKAGAKVLLLGMQLPPNYGKSYTERFAAMYPELARSEGCALVPFFLRGVADAADPLRWFQSDRIHPNAAAQPILLDNVWPTLQAWL